MKKNISYIIRSLIFLAIFLVVNTGVFAATTPTPNNSLLQQLTKEIASKTAQLNLVEKRGIIGTVIESSDTQITVSDLSTNQRFIDVDELTKFFSSDSQSIGISDITKGTSIGVLGLYNKQSRRILAREVDILSPFPTIIFGGISSIDNVNYQVTIVKENGIKTVVEVESITKTYAFSAGQLAKSGFSKMQQTETAIIIGFPDKQDSSKILASRIILLPNVDLTSRINFSASQIPTIPPSTGSGGKLFPITK